MTNKIFRSIFTASLSSLLAALIVVCAALYGYYANITVLQLQSQLDYAAEAVSVQGIPYMKNVADENFRLTLIAPDGRVLYDTTADESQMDNHLEREEIQEVLEKGEGDASRFSATQLEKTIYYAKAMPDGNILRISTTQLSVFRLMLGIMQPIIIILVLMLGLSALLAKRMSDGIVKPLNALDLEKPLENEIYDEISPLLSHIEQQNKKIRKQIERLKKNQTEFAALIQNMNDGLVILNAENEILTLNHAAELLFQTDQSAIGKDFLTIDRSLEIIKALQTAKECGHSETDLHKDGRVYLLNMNITGDSQNAPGIIILAIDATDKIFAERNRKEFTANVSHELKTPLQSIMGSSELIESGLVSDADLPKFISKIRTEAARLVSLIDDIIGLSRLDEKADIKMEAVELFSLSRDVIAELAEKAEKNGVTVHLEGRETHIRSEHRLVHEILYNLCDNAIKYNKENGSVTVSIAETETAVRLTVADTGIGIPAEHQPRVFERFFRVDKSHSREIGGTGLGLSIVKHAAECIGAEIALQSREGDGTEITVIFPKN